MAEGYELAGFKVESREGPITGPADRVNALRKAMTETVWLDGRKESFNLANVAINIPDPRVDVLDPTVDIRVEIVAKKPSDGHLTFISA